MANDAFTAGVVPGGLISHAEIKILLCYIMQSISAPVAHDELVNSLTDKGLANYFELNDGISELLASGHVRQNNDYYTLTESGWQIAGMLSGDLPLTVRERAVEAVKAAIELARKRRQNKVDIRKTENGYELECRVLDDSAGLLYALTVYAPTKEAARKMGDNFIRNAEELLRQDYSLLTGEEI